MKKRSPVPSWSLYLCVVVACDGADSRPYGGLSFVDSVTVEENSAVITVSPILTVLDDSTWLVVDAREQQVRLYSRAGGLKAFAGRKGDGPGEFQTPIASGRLSDGRIWVLEFTGRLTMLSPDLSRVQTQPTGLMPVYAAQTLSGDSLLVMGRSAVADSALIHVLDPVAGSIARSFFRPQPSIPAELAPMVRFAAFAGADTRGDTIAAVFSVLDTIFLFSRGGESLERIGIRAAAFRRIAEASAEGEYDPRRMVELFSSLNTIKWLSDGAFVVQFSDAEGKVQRNTLVNLSRDGEMRLEIQAPRLLDVWRDTLITVHPDDGVLDRWLIAVLFQH